MSPTLLIVLISIGIVAFFVVGMSLTLIFKGHHIDSEIGDNEHMKQRGIKCAAQQIREEEAALRGETLSDTDCDGYGCASCTIGNCAEHK